MPRVTIDINQRLCTGCRLCEIVCAQKHGFGVRVEASRIQVQQFPPGPVDVPVVCRQCKDHPCASACPVTPPAIRVDPETGAIVIDSQACISCHYCVEACPQATAVFVHPSTGELLVCDLCGGDPECVKVCPAGTLSSLQGSSFDGAHYAAHPPGKVASDLAFQFFPRRPDHKQG